MSKSDMSGDAVMGCLLWAVIIIAIWVGCSSCRTSKSKDATIPNGYIWMQMDTVWIPVGKIDTLGAFKMVLPIKDTIKKPRLKSI